MKLSYEDRARQAVTPLTQAAFWLSPSDSQSKRLSTSLAEIFATTVDMHTRYTRQVEILHEFIAHCQIVNKLENDVLEGYDNEQP